MKNKHLKKNFSFLNSDYFQFRFLKYNSDYIQSTQSKESDNSNIFFWSYSSRIADILQLVADTADVSSSDWEFIEIHWQHRAGQWTSQQFVATLNRTRTSINFHVAKHVVQKTTFTEQSTWFSVRFCVARSFSVRSRCEARGFIKQAIASISTWFRQASIRSGSSSISTQRARTAAE